MASGSGNKPTMVHFALIIFVMASLISTVIAVMGHNDTVEIQARLAQLTTENSSLQTVNRKRDEDNQAMKAMLGKLHENVGPDTDQNTVLGDFKTELARAASQAANATDALRALRQQIDTVTQERNTLQTEVNDLKSKNSQLNAQYGQQSDQFRTNANTAEANLQASIKEKEASLNEKNQQINTETSKARDLATKLEQTEEHYKKLVASMTDEIKKLHAINDKIRGELDEVTRVSFEKPDGELQYVDYNSRLVWVNLGESDKLPVGATFSVYSKGHHGVGRGAEDIKGSIEITRIIKSHLAEGRILKDDPAQPMAKGDPIYTPLWNAGRKEAIAIAGFIDLDGDGQSDRPMFHDLVLAYGASIDVEIDDAGTRLGDGLTPLTKYLVIADVRDASKAIGPNEKEAAEKVLAELKRLRDECRLQGIRTITLNDFLAQIGYTPQRRNWRPGQESPFTLKSGSQSTGVNQTLGNRESAGTVSGAYKNSKRVGPAPSAAGTTSKLFKGGTGGR